MLGEADDNRDGFLTQAQWSKVELWFQYKAFLPGGEDDLEAQNAITSAQAQQRAYDRWVGKERARHRADATVSSCAALQPAPCP